MRVAPDFFSVRPHDRAHWVALRAALSMAIPVLIVWQLGHLDWLLYVAFGAFSSVYGRHQSYPDRLRMQLGSGLTIAVAIAVGTAVSVIAPGSLLSVAAMAAASAIGFLLSRKEGWLPPGSLFFVFAAGATSSFAHRASDIPLSFGLACIAALFATALGQAGRFTAVGRAAEKRPKPARVTWRALLSTPGVRWEVARYAIGPLVAGSAATLLGIGHPYWAAVSATVPLAGITLDAQFTRALHRLAGSLLGVGLAFLVLATNPNDVVMIVIIVALQAFAELFVMRNYGLTVIGLTPLALLLSHLASPTPVTQLIGDRAIETCIGVVVAVAVMLLVRPRARARAVAAA
jgi:Fusaric acid resistance protein-like